MDDFIFTPDRLENAASIIWLLNIKTLSRSELIYILQNKLNISPGIDGITCQIHLSIIAFS